MKIYAVIAVALLTFTSSFALAMDDESPSSTRLDCGELNEAQVARYEKDLSSEGLIDLAMTCSDQAATFQAIATQASTALTTEEVTHLFEKAAAAHLHVASFSNSAFLK